MVESCKMMEEQECSAYPCPAQNQQKLEGSRELVENNH